MHQANNYQIRQHRTIFIGTFKHKRTSGSCSFSCERFPKQKNKYGDLPRFGPFSLFACGVASLRKRTCEQETQAYDQRTEPNQDNYDASGNEVIASAKLGKKDE